VRGESRQPIVESRKKKKEKIGHRVRKTQRKRKAEEEKEDSSLHSK
jgi:hypothetical protein